MSLALLEAMAAGVPVIATDISGNRQLIEHDVHGLLVPPRDPDALHQAIERLLVDRKLAAQLGASARERVAREFSLARMVDRYLEVIDQSVIARQR